MSQLLSELLSYPYEKEQLIQPDQEAQTLIWGAEYTAALATRQTAWIQSFKPYADHLGNKNIQVVQSPEKNKQYQQAFCVLPKQKEESLYILASCLDSLEDKGILIAAASNDAGGKRLEKWFQELGIKPNSLSKSKCRIVWGNKVAPNKEKIKHYIEAGSPQEITIENQTFCTKPGIYGWNKIDQGSKILVENLPHNLSGTGADFGCGYGYLSKKILDGNRQLKKLYAIDADYNAVLCCQKNLKQYEENISIEYLWEDLTKRPDNITSLDWIVMNPPFHEGKDTHIDVGQKFIETAALSLRKKGVLYMVANAHLPYEKMLQTLFESTEKIIEKQGFKIFKAVK